MCDDVQVNRRRPGELYSGNINTIMDNIQDEEPKSDAGAEPTPAAGSDGKVLAFCTIHMAFGTGWDWGVGWGGGGESFLTHLCSGIVSGPFMRVTDLTNLI